MPMVEDLSAFVDTSEHGTAAQLDGVAVAGIFDNPAADVSGMGVTRPTFTLPAASAPYVEAGSTLLIGTDVYRVKTPEPDGTGLVVLPLELDA